MVLGKGSATATLTTEDIQALLTAADDELYADYREIDPAAWRGREQEGMLFVPHAGEMLYRAHGM